MSKPATTLKPEKQYCISFYGSFGSSHRMPRHRIWHETLEEARDEIARVDRERSGSGRAAEPGIVHGPAGETFSGG